MMKKMAMWLAIAAVAGAGLCAVALSEMQLSLDGKEIQVRDLFKGGGAVQEIHQEEVIPAQGLEKLTLDGVSEDLYVLYEDRSDVKVTFEGQASVMEGTQAPKLVVRTVGSRTDVSIERSLNNFGFNVQYDMKLVAVLPLNLKPELDLHSVLGNIQASAGKAVKAKTISGDLTLSVSDGVPVTAETTSGNLKLEGDAGALDLKSVSGNLDAYVETLKGDVAMKNTSGNCTLRMKDLGEGFQEAESVSGDIRFDLPGVSNVEDAHSQRVEMGKGTYRITLKSVSGNLALGQEN